MLNPEDDVPSHEELKNRVDELEEEKDKTLEQAVELLEKYEELDTQYRNTSGNDDGNEDHPETYSGDNEGSSGADKGEEIAGLSNFIESSDTFDSNLAEIYRNIDSADTVEKKLNIQEQIDNLESDFKDSKPDCLD